MTASAIPPAILSYLHSQKTLTVATCADATPYCAICYYAFSEEFCALIFKSSPDTRHIREGLANNNVAGTVLSAETRITRLRGLQFEGTFIALKGQDLETAAKIYYKRFPFAKLIPGELWKIDLSTLKFTDNLPGFATKSRWERA